MTLAASSSHFISWPFSNPSPRKCAVTHSQFSMQEIMNDRSEKLIAVMSGRPDPSTSLPTNQQLFNATEIQPASCNEVVFFKALALPLLAITLSAPLNSFTLINKQFSVAFCWCHLSLENVNACQKLA